MFGYVIANQNELKLKEYERYRAYYCGLCRTLRRRYGTMGQMLLSYDLTFLYILLEALYEVPLTDTKKRCAVHPAARHRMLFNEVAEYTADMCVLLSYHKLADDWKDERSIKGRAGADLLRRSFRKVEKEYPKQAQAVRECMQLLSRYESENETDLDKVSGLTGHMLAAVFGWKKDEWTDELMSVGFYLGKYIYLLDAYDDLGTDLKKKRYNVWTSYRTRRDFEALVENTLTMMMSECARYFERLPIVQDADILRNILYSGVWTKYRQLKNKEEKENAK